MYGDGWRWVREDGTFLYSKDRIWWSTEPSPVQRSMDQWVGALHGEEVETVEEMPQRGTLPQRSAPDILAAAADTFRERNVTYGNNYKEFGKMFSALFPHGLSLPPNDYAAYNRLGLLVMCAVKLSRYANGLYEGGHVDSAHDLCVYAAMLEEMTEKSRD